MWCPGLYRASHFPKKVNLHIHLRYDPINTLGICQKHHGPWNGVHGYPHMFEQAIHTMVDKIHGLGSYERLEARAYMTGSKTDLALVELWLWQEFKSLGISKPPEWSEWKETPKINWLRQLRKMRSEDADTT